MTDTATAHKRDGLDAGPAPGRPALIYSDPTGNYRRWAIHLADLPGHDIRRGVATLIFDSIEGRDRRWFGSIDSREGIPVRSLEPEEIMLLRDRFDLGDPPATASSQHPSDPMTNSTITREGFTAADLAACAEREVTQRQRAYPRWVEAGRMTRQLADRQTALMQAIARKLRAEADAEGAKGDLFGGEMRR